MIALHLMRHAKSDWDAPADRDFDRPLNDRGRRSAERIGRELKRLGLSFDHLLASPAVRVRETLDWLARSYGALPQPQFDARLYAADDRTLLDAVAHLPGDSRASLIVGHNPGLHALLLRLTSASPERTSVEGKFPTAAFAAIDFPADDWSDVAPGSGRIGALILPRALD